MVAIGQSPCDPDKLRLLIQDHLTASGKARLIQHLDGCPACCQRLERLAADAAFWQDTEHFLGDEETAQVAGLTQEYLAADVPTDSLIALTLDSLQPPTTPAALGRIDEYEILEVIGRGGSGVVLKGYEPELNRVVAIKVLSPHVASHGAARQRFEREAKAAAAVVHPHVVAIHGINSRARLPYLVMQWISGDSLEHRLRRDGPLPVRDIVRIAHQVAEGLAAAHDRGLVHRDIKPGNILLEKNVDRVLITDFGLARTVDDATLTCTGMIAGTPAYMSPEQARGDLVGPSSDLFSLGSVMHAMCTGESPFTADSTVAILRRVSDDQSKNIRQLNPDIPTWLVTLISRLHEKDPLRRPRGTRQVADWLKQCLAHVQEPDRLPLPAELRAPRSWRQAWRPLLAICLVLAAGVMATSPWSPQTGTVPATSAGDDSTPPQNHAKVEAPSSDLRWQTEANQELRSIESAIDALEGAGDGFSP